jgi:hypothetical protein
VVAGLEVLAAALILLFTPRRMAQIGMCQQRHGGRWRLLNGRGGRK